MPRLTDATKAARRTQIIEAAIDCFLDHGYTNTSMSDIIKASGLSSGSIYSHFSGKEDILISAINERLNNCLLYTSSVLVRVQGWLVGGAGETVPACRYAAMPPVPRR